MSRTDTLTDMTAWLRAEAPVHRVEAEQDLWLNVPRPILGPLPTR